MKYIIKNINEYNKNDIDSFYKKIPFIKRNKIDKLKNDIDKKRSIIGELLLSDLLKDEYNNINYIINEYGKPYIENKKIFFSISHSYDYVIAAISDKEIGIDIEKIRKTNINTINEFASSKEKEYILSSRDNIEKRLFQIYTLKEAYIKMKGTNLNNAFEVEFNISNNKITSNNSINTSMINIIDDYVISYCENK